MTVGRTSARALAAALVVLAACSSERDDVTGPGFGGGAGAGGDPVPAPATIETVAMIGDSITVGAEAELRRAIGRLPVELVAVDAAVGRRMTVDGAVDAGLDAVGRLAATAPDLWVVALGTNDLGLYAGAEQYRAAIDELLAAVPRDAPLVWVDAYVAGQDERSAEFNATLADALGARGRATVVRWAPVADDDGVLRDGVHPTPAGDATFAELVAAGVADWLA